MNYWEFNNYIDNLIRNTDDDFNKMQESIKNEYIRDKNTLVNFIFNIEKLILQYTFSTFLGYFLSIMNNKNINIIFFTIVCYITIQLLSLIIQWFGYNKQLKYAKEKETYLLGEISKLRSKFHNKIGIISFQKDDTKNKETIFFIKELSNKYLFSKIEVSENLNNKYNFIIKFINISNILKYIAYFFIIVILFLIWKFLIIDCKIIVEILK